MVEKIMQLNTEKNIFWTLISLLFFCLCFYMYSINVTVRNVVLRENLQGKISSLSLSVSNNEFQYINGQNAVTIALAHSLGFTDVAQKTYVFPNTTSLAYSFSAEIVVR